VLVMVLVGVGSPSESEYTRGEEHQQLRYKR
jgi:hypothetical protein